MKMKMNMNEMQATKKSHIYVVKCLRKCFCVIFKSIVSGNFYSI